MNFGLLTLWERVGFIGGIAVALTLLAMGIESMRIQRSNQANIAAVTTRIVSMEETLNSRAVLLKNLDADSRQTRAILDARTPVFDAMKLEIAAHHREIEDIKQQLAATQVVKP